MSVLDHNKPIAIEVTMEHWNDVVSFNQTFLANFVFRGQANSEWNLSSSLERVVHSHHPTFYRSGYPNSYEAKMLEEFKYKYPLYAQNVYPKEDENTEWLALMQHYGAPTRLLDFSKSIFVALFMALDNSFSDNSVIWAINKFAIERKHIEKYMQDNHVSILRKDVSCKYIHDRANSYIDIVALPNTEKEILPVYPRLCNERIAIQQGLFLMASNLTVPFIEVFNSFFQIDSGIQTIPVKELLDYSYTIAKNKNNCDITIFKIIIPKKFKWELTQLLKQMNITAETLYPGLSGLAKSLSALQMSDNNTYTE